MSYTFTTDRFSCSLVDGDDKPKVGMLYQHKKVMRMIGPPLSAEDASALADKMTEFNKQPLPALKVWRITAKDTAQFAGIQMLKWKDGKEANTAEIGIMLAPEANHKGVAVEAMGALVRFAFRNLEVSQIVANFHDRHLATEKLVRSLGFVASDCAPTADNQRRFIIYRP